MHKLLVVLLTCCACLGATALQLPAYIKKCSIKDPNFDSCALKNAKDAIPYIVKGDEQHKLPVLDPLLITELTVNEKQLNGTMLGTNVTGLKDLDLQSIRFDFHNKNITVEGRVPKLDFTGDYEMSGNLVDHDIYGTGKFNATFRNAFVKYTTSYSLKALDDGEVYLVLQNYNLDIDPENITVELGNLFDGNKVQGDEMNKFINDNWRQVLDQTGPEVWKSLGLIIRNIFKEAATTVPLKNIFNDTE